MSAPGTTPGRWRVSTSPITKARGIDIIAGYDRIVASVPVKPDYMSRRSHVEDANLIAAASDLFEALLLWQTYDDQDEADFAQAGPILLYARAINATRAALTKARGEAK